MQDDITIPKGTDETITRMVGNKDATLTQADYVDLQSAYWDGGSKSAYRAFDRFGYARELPQHGGAPQFGGNSARVQLSAIDAQKPSDEIERPIAYIVTFSTFRGKKMPPRVAMHPSRFAAFEAQLAPELPLTVEERMALQVTSNLKAFARKDEFARDFPVSCYQPARDSLASKGLLTKRGAITPAGRNALRR